MLFHLSTIFLAPLSSAPLISAPRALSSTVSPRATRDPSSTCPIRCKRSLTPPLSSAMLPRAARRQHPAAIRIRHPQPLVLVHCHRVPSTLEMTSSPHHLTALSLVGASSEPRHKRHYSLIFSVRPRPCVSAHGLVPPLTQWWRIVSSKSPLHRTSTPLPHSSSWRSFQEHISPNCPSRLPLPSAP